MIYDFCLIKIRITEKKKSCGKGNIVSYCKHCHKKYASIFLTCIINIIYRRPKIVFHGVQYFAINFFSNLVNSSSDACREGRRTRVIDTHPFSLAVVIIAPYHLPVAHTIAEAVRPVVLRVSVGLASSARGTVVSLLRDLREVTRDGHPRTLELTMRPFRHDAVADSASSMGLREDACRVGYKGCGERRVAGGGRLGAVCIAASRRLLCAFGGR